MTDERRSGDRTAGYNCLEPARPRIVRFTLRAPGPELLASCSRIMGAASPKGSTDLNVSRSDFSVSSLQTNDTTQTQNACESGSTGASYTPSVQKSTTGGEDMPSQDIPSQGALGSAPPPTSLPQASVHPENGLPARKFTVGVGSVRPPSFMGRVIASIGSRADLWAASTLSLVWGSGVASAYISSVGSLQAIIRLSPLELSALAAVLVGPVFTVWILAAFYRRNSILCTEASLMRERISELNYPAKNAEGHVARIADSLRAQTTELSEATWAAANQAATIRDTIGAETRHLEQVASAIDERAAPVLERASVHIQQLSDLIEKVSGTTTAFDAALSRHYSDLAEATQRTELASSELTASLTRQCEQVQVLGGEIEARNSVVEDLVTRQEALLTSAREAADLFNHAVTALMVGAAKASHGLTKRAEAIDTSIASMTTHVQTLTDSTTGALGQMDVLGKRLDEQGARLHTHHHDITEMAQMTTRELEAASATALGDFNTLRDAATDTLEGIHTAAAALRDTASHTEAVRRLLHTQTKELGETAQRMGEEIRSAGMLCGENATQITQSTDRSAERIHHLVDLLSRNAVEITRTAARSVVEIETVNEAMKRGALAAVDVSREISDATKSVAVESDHAVSRVRAATDSMTHGVDAIESAGQAFGDEAARISEAANATIVTIRTLAADLSKETHRFGETSDTALQRAEDVRTALSATIASFEAGIDGGVERVSAVGSSLTKGSQEFMTVARSTVEVLNGAGGALRAQVDALGKATDEADERLQTVIRSLGESGDLVARVGTTVTDRANRAGEEFSRRASELSSAAEEAKEKAQELLMARQDVDVQKFLTETSYVIERLQSTAVDITRLFNPSVEADLWKRFYKGEQNVFLHYAARTITRSQSQAIKKLYTESREFRHYAGRYITEFEALLKGARTNDRGDVLTAIFTSSDMGRLYVVLARSLGRMGGE